VDLISDKKGIDLILLDTRAVSVLADYVIVATGESERQLKAIASDVQKQLKQHRILPLGAEGTAESGWILLDYNSVIAHLFSPAMRDYYLLEELYENAPVVVKMP
jgi:ribosome-associated protein